MKLLSFIAFCLLLLPLPATITEWYVGTTGVGAGASEGDAMSFLTFEDHMKAGGSLTAAVGARYNIKVGTYTNASDTDTWANGGTAVSPVVVRGYSATISPHDGYLGRVNNNGALITDNFPTISYTTGLLNITGSFIMLENLIVSGQKTGTISTINGTDCVMRACKVTNAPPSMGSSGCLSLTGRVILIDSDFELGPVSTTLEAISVAQVGCRILCCRINSSGIGISVTSGATIIYGNTIHNCILPGISLSSVGAYSTIINNTIVGVGGALSDGIKIVSSTTTTHVILNNVITDSTNARGIAFGNTSIPAIVGYNRFRDNLISMNNAGDWTTATNWLQVDSGTTGDTSTDYVDFAGRNYNLKGTSPATSTGLPAKSSIGALQRDQVSKTTIE